MSARPVVLLTNPIDPAGAEALGRHAEVRTAPAADAESLRAAVRGADALIVRATLPDDLFEYAPRLRGVVRHGAGVDMIPLPQASAAAIPVANTPAVNASSVAEHVIGQMLSLAHRLASSAVLLRAKGWAEARAHAGRATELAGKTAGIVGIGAVGAEVARVCLAGFGMRVLGHQRHLDRLPQGVERADLETLFRTSDYVVLSCTLTEETRGLASRALIALMKPAACLVNVARGAVVDEPALVEALRERRIAGAALDVFCEQPLAPGHPLLALDNALLTPHAAGIAVESMQRMSALAVDEVLRMLRGELPRHLVNREVADAARERWARLGRAPLAP